MKKKIIISIIVVVFTTILGSGYYIYSMFGKIQRERLPENDLELGISEEPPPGKLDGIDNNERGKNIEKPKITKEAEKPQKIGKSENEKKLEAPGNSKNNSPQKPKPGKSQASRLNKNTGVINIAFFGIDARSSNQAAPTDSIIIVSLDRKHQKIKVTSVMRDLYVSVPEMGAKKINLAYVFGGPPLAVKTLNTNLGLDIRNFVTVNFFGLEKLINRVGGITVNVKKYEVMEINKYIREVSSIKGDRNPPLLKGEGRQYLNGRQAVAYARIRNVGWGDFERTERQRVVLNELFKKIKAQGVAKLPGTISTILPYVKTSLSNSDIMWLAKDALGYNVNTIEQFRLPVDGYFKETSIMGMYVIKANMPVNRSKLHDFIYTH